MREINALEQHILAAEDETDWMLWEQALKVVEQLDAGMSQRALAKQWINVRTNEPYSQVHVHRVATVVARYVNVSPRQPFREAYNEVANAKPMAVHQSSATAEHYTPPEVIAAVVACLGGIDLDPCSNSGATPNVPARMHFTEEDDGLSRPWHGSVYMNPPYGDEIDGWVTKLCEEHRVGRVQEAIALVPARTDTQWFAKLRDHVCCFVTGRLTFIGNKAAAPFPSAVFYLGTDVGAFYRAFSAVGDIWQRIEPGMFGE
jgi:phage N-6-adenine-methyltransferase